MTVTTDQLDMILGLYKEGSITSVQARAKLLDMLTDNQEHIQQYIEVLAEEISLNAYRQGFVDGSSTEKTYRFEDYQQAQALKATILELMKKLV